MDRLMRIFQKNVRLIIGLMSGTSVDGIDAALIRVEEKGYDRKIELLEFETFAYSDAVRQKIFELFLPSTGSVDKICHMNFLLGELFADAALKVIKKAKLTPDKVDLIGSHGQTIYHMPNPIQDCGYSIKSTLQIGEPAIIAERTGIVTVADFRVRDMAAGGQGAPLVAYTDFILYKEEGKTVVLQNIGGISNATVLPKSCQINEVIAFDNGPGNMVIDEVVRRITNGRLHYDDKGSIAAKGKVNETFLNELLKDNYFNEKPPKTTGREHFGVQYVDKLMSEANKKGINGADLIATVTALTAKSIALSYINFVIPKYGIDKVIISGGGAHNITLIEMIKTYLDGIKIFTQEDIGLDSDAKEAIAIAILANETINGNFNNIPTATGAKHPVIMGKISL